MRKSMNISVNGQSRVPPGFRFHPTEEELLQYYLRKKVANEKIDLDVIFEVDLNKLEPWDIQEKCKIGTTPQNDWYIFSHKDKKYPTGTRTNRATMAGFWKATGRDKVIYGNGMRIGMRKTLVFYKGRAPHGQKSDWIMHEYRLDESSNTSNDSHGATHAMNGDFAQEEGWVVCRIFKKKNHLKALDSFTSTTFSNMSLESHTCTLDSPSDNDNEDQGALEEIFQSIGSKQHHQKTIIKSTFHNVDKFMKLPSLESPNNSTQLASCYHPIHHENDVVSIVKSIDFDPNPMFLSSESELGDWATLDKLVATHLNGHQTTDTTLSSIFSSPTTTIDLHNHQDDIQLIPSRSSSLTSSDTKIYHQHATTATMDNYESNEIIDLWNFTRSSLQIDPLCHVSDTGV